MQERPASDVTTEILAVEGDAAHTRSDRLAAEEPLEIRLVAAGERKPVAITMRTPGNDFELAVGFLHGEGVIASRRHIRRITYCVDRDVAEEQRFNIVNVELSRDALPELGALERHFHVTSACGVCGKATLDALRLRLRPTIAEGPTIDATDLYELSKKLGASQGIFRATGGLHAAALFDDSMELVGSREDVGRHNAVDKLIGSALLEGRVPLHDHVLMVSGRASFEIMQKSLAAGVAVVCAVSAPSSLAVALAQEFGMTLIGFLRDKRFNVYAGAQRIRVPAPVGR